MNREVRGALILGVVVALAGAGAGRKAVTIDEAAKTARPDGSPVWAPSGTQFVFRSGKQLKLWNQSAHSVLIEDLESLDGQAASSPEGPFQWVNRGVRESEVQWVGSGKLLIARKGDLFLFDIATRKHRQLTKTPVAEADPKLSPDDRKVSFRREHDLYVMDIESGKTMRLTHGGTATRKNAELDWVYPEELGIQTAYWWSPDGRRIAYLQFDTSATLVYPHGDLLGVRPVSEPERYPQAGTPNPAVRLGIVASGGGKTKWIDLPGGPEMLTARVTWLPDSSGLAVHRLNRVQNKLQLLRVAAGQVKTLLEETDSAWVNLKDDFHFLGKGEHWIWGSERDGFRHMYMARGDAVRPITSGPWEVTELACVDEKAERIYYVSTEAGPRERQVYSIGFDGSGKKRLTAAHGTHGVNFAPDCSVYFSTHSSVMDPPLRAVYSAAGEQLTILKDRDRRVADEFEILPTEWVEFKAKDGDAFLARLIKPAGFDPAKKYPAVVQVYGGPHAQTVRDLWKGADWDQYLAHSGFVIWQMDNRGSAFRGHAWEARVNRRFGKQELADQLEGVEHLLSLGFVDAARIGIQGWSYGGYMTLYSLLNAPDRFRAGISGAPVTDWRNYDTIYTERYMGLPQENEDGYKASSPVNQAENLKSKLMLVHNFEDDNVLFQHTMRMMNALQKAGKHYEFQLYPQKAHGVTGAALKKHMYKAMAEFWDRALKGD
ncbi:MAG: S9 family peptidase [Bryobacteraceae bacterium]